MTPPPTSIDGSDITGATIDGQEVQEITIDGQIVFQARPPIPGSLVSEWFNNEGTGTTSLDQRRSFDATWDIFKWGSGAGPGGTHIDSTSKNSEGGQITGGLSDWSHFTGTPEGTIMAWINMDSTAAQNIISVYDYHSSGNGGGFVFYYSNQLGTIGNDNGNFPNNFASGISLDTNEWYFVALAMDGSSFEFYASEEPNFTNLQSSTFSNISTIPSASKDPSIGGDTTNDSGRAFDGKMSVFAKTDVKMTQSEIEAYRDATKADFP